jgi:hypothetical protein
LANVAADRCEISVAELIEQRKLKVVVDQASKFRCSGLYRRAKKKVAVTVS